MDSFNVTITIKTFSVNGRQGEPGVDDFTNRVVQAANESLDKSTLEIEVYKHRIIRA